MKEAAFHPSFYSKNRERLSAILPEQTMALIVSNDQMPRSGDQYYTFRQNSDLFYLSGITQPRTVLALCPDHPNPKHKEVLFILRADAVREAWDGHRLTPPEATRKSGIKTVFPVDHFDQIMDDLAYPSKQIYLNIAENTRSADELTTHAVRMANHLKVRYPLHPYGRLAPLMSSLRFKKQPEEIQMIRNACEITGNAFERVLHQIRPGMYEYEIEAEMTCEMIRRGASGHAFHPVVASGRNACVLHYNANNAVTGENDLILLDFGAELAYYASDCSRTVPVSGRFTRRQRQLYDAVLRVFYKVRQLMHSGVSITQINIQTGRFWEEEHVRLGLYSMEDLKRQDPDSPLFQKYFMHGVTHSIGLDVHDTSDRYQPLEPGMVLTCEPGIYLPEEGLGIRIENDVLITPSDPIDLMSHIPVEAEEIEAIMNS